jgi:anthraniloyl-CoA monooxygenase
MSLRLSCSDWADGGLTLEDLGIYARLFKQAGVDIIHASSGQTVPWQKPVYGRMWQTPFAEYIRQSADIPTIAVGDITLAEQINTIIAASRADLCALARPMLNNPFFARQAAGHYAVRTACGVSVGWPVQLRSGEYQLYREAEKTNERLAELSAKARPNRRHYLHAKG